MAHEIYIWVVTAITGAIALNTVARLWIDRNKFWREDLQDEERSFAWRIVLFIIFPLLTLLDLRATVVACQLMGGYVKDWSYGIFWFNAIPAGLPNNDHLTAILFAGVAMQMALSLCLLFSLFFRPHPFLSTIIGYTISFVLALNLIVDPVLSLAGLGGSRWPIAMSVLPIEEKYLMAAIYVVAASIFILTVFNQGTRLWFASLTRPVVAEQLEDALIQWRQNPNNPLSSCRLALLYERAGLAGEAAKIQTSMIKEFPYSIYTVFLQSVLTYRGRKFNESRAAFLRTSDFPRVDGTLKASLLAASGCAAFASGDYEGALNLAERALEFDDASLVARMVKVDVFLRTDRKEQAGEEILCAIRRGLDLDIEDKIPLDTDRALQKLARLHSVYESSLQEPLRSA